MKWVPVSERLPKITVFREPDSDGSCLNESKPVLVSLEEPFDVSSILIAVYEEVVEKDGTVSHAGWSNVPDYNSAGKFVVTAWKPLPRPYKGGIDRDERRQAEDP